MTAAAAAAGRPARGRARPGHAIANLNPHFRRIVRRAGLVPWERTWHNLRVSPQTEFDALFLLHTVCAWIGNTKAVAMGRCLQVTDADWARAVGGSGPAASSECGANPGARPAQNPAQHGREPRRTEPQPSP